LNPNGGLVVCRPLPDQPWLTGAIRYPANDGLDGVDRIRALLLEGTPEQVIPPSGTTVYVLATQVSLADGFASHEVHFFGDLVVIITSTMTIDTNARYRVYILDEMLRGHPTWSEAFLVSGVTKHSLTFSVGPQVQRVGHSLTFYVVRESSP